MSVGCVGIDYSGLRLRLIPPYVIPPYQKNVSVLWGPTVPCSLSRPTGVPAGSEASLLCVVVCKPYPPYGKVLGCLRTAELLSRSVPPDQSYRIEHGVW